MQRFKYWMPWLLMAGNFGFPAATAIIGWVYSQGPFPFVEAVDWDGTSPPAQALKAIVLFQVLYVPLATLLSPRRRMAAFLVGLVVLLFSMAVHFLAYITVTRIYPPADWAFHGACWLEPFHSSFL